MFFQLPPAILTPIPGQEHWVLGALAPSCVSEAAMQQPRLESTPSWHHLSALHHHLRVCWKGERGSRRAKHYGEKRSLLQRLSKGTVITGSCILCLRLIKSETKTGSSLGLLQTCINHKALNLSQSCFTLFLFWGSSGTADPTYNCTVGISGHCLQWADLVMTTTAARSLQTSLQSFGIKGAFQQSLLLLIIDFSKEMNKIWLQNLFVLGKQSCESVTAMFRAATSSDRSALNIWGNDSSRRHEGKKSQVPGFLLLVLGKRKH